MPFITYPQPNGQVAVIIPVDLSLSLEEIAAKSVPGGAPFKIVDSLDIDDSYFNAYEYQEELGAEVNINKAKDIHLNMFRTARAPKLQKLDVDYMKAMESQDPIAASAIAAAKQELRDVTKVVLPNTLEELKQVWPEILTA